uniref:Uncharacterized protein n=1 Tax=Anguilla anguilla TaxID=7936 RepID=A0A0E9VJK9_ANGAN
MSRAEQALFLYDQWDREVKADIICRPPVEINDPDQILTVLLEIYGCSLSYIVFKTVLSKTTGRW